MKAMLKHKWNEKQHKSLIELKLQVEAEVCDSSSASSSSAEEFEDLTFGAKRREVKVKMAEVKKSLVYTQDKLYQAQLDQINKELTELHNHGTCDTLRAQQQVLKDKFERNLKLLEARKEVRAKSIQKAYLTDIKAIEDDEKEWTTLYRGKIERTLYKFSRTYNPEYFQQKDCDTTEGREQLRKKIEIYDRNLDASNVITSEPPITVTEGENEGQPLIKIELDGDTQVWDEFMFKVMRENYPVHFQVQEQPREASVELVQLPLHTSSNTSLDKSETESASSCQSDEGESELCEIISCLQLSEDSN